MIEQPRQPTLTTDVAAAARCLRAGGLVAFPTETVYGLGALADDDQAVRRVFTAKGRPSSHPLIVHLADPSELREWAAELPPWAAELARRAWPGPLTLVVARAPRVSDVVTGGLPTVGLRIPDHPVALDLLRQTGSGVAAPSANRFGGVSATTAAHVVTDLTGHLDPDRDLVLDGGDCPVGVESTIVLATGAVPRLLRPGALSERTIADITGLAVAPDDGSVRAPGTLPSHYAPATPLVLVSPDALAAWAGRSDTGVIAPSSVAVPDGPQQLARPESIEGYARDLYRALRRADEIGLAQVVVVPPAGEEGLAIAVRDRLRRAAH